MSEAVQDEQHELRELRAEWRRVREQHGRRSERTREAFETLFRAAIASGRPLDMLRRHSPDEQERFFARTVPGDDEHVYWDGAKDGFRTNDGRRRKPVRWWWAHLGRPLVQTDDLIPTCDAVGCIHPDHHRRGRSERRQWYSDTAMIGRLQVEAMRLGRAPTTEHWRAAGLNPVTGVYKRRFGSWAKALRAAGLR